MKLRLIFFCCLFCWSTLSYGADTYTFASLKKKEVNWRTGPGEKYPIQWVYQEQGYPVKVLDSYDIWRQVQDASGSIGWVHQNMLSDRRTVLVEDEGSLTSKPNAGGKIIAFVEPDTLARVLRCPADYTDCLLQFRFRDQDFKGWFPRSAIWGLKPGEEID